MLRSGLIGRDITKSRSPWLHEQEAGAQGFDLRYELFDFTDRGLPDSALPGLLRDLKDQGFAGFNVTYPFKQAVTPFLHSLGDSAALVGAVNTVAIRDGELIGYNTDYSGFRSSLLKGLDGRSPGRVLQMGAGGAGSAVASALLSSEAATLSIFDVDHDRADDLASRMADRFPGGSVIALAALPGDLSGFDGIVNSTPIGMYACPGSPIDPALLSPRHWVADIVYFPLETEFLRDARAIGALSIDGAGMVVNQAASAFEIITGHAADADRMHRSFFAQS